MVWRFKSSPRHQVLEATRGMNTHSGRGYSGVSGAGEVGNAFLLASFDDGPESSAGNSKLS